MEYEMSQDDKPKVHRRIEDESETLPRLDLADIAQTLGAEEVGPAYLIPGPLGRKCFSKRAMDEATKKRLDAAGEKRFGPEDTTPIDHPWPVDISAFSKAHRFTRENIRKSLAMYPKCEMRYCIDAYFWKLSIPFREGRSGAEGDCIVLVKSTHGMGLEDGHAYEDAKLWVDNNLSVNEAQRAALHKAIDEAEIDHVDHEAEAAGLEWKLRGHRRNAQGKLISARIDPRDMEKLLRTDAVDAAEKWLRGSTADRDRFTTKREGLLLALYVEAASKLMEDKDV
jgi:hypothetical protein